MKRLFPLLLLCLLLTGCGRAKVEQTVYEYNGFTVDTQAQTITQGDDVYYYTYSFNGVTITYPNGAEYWWQYEQSGGHGGWNGDYDTDRYADGWTLVNALSYRPAQEKSGGGNRPLGALLMIFGLFHLIAPSTAWYLSHGWRFKDAEPSELVLALNRLVGGITLLVGFLLFL